MTKKEILATKAGGGLDELIEREVFGWEPKPTKDGDVQEYYRSHFPSYSTDISYAWQVEEKVKKLGLIEQYASHLLILTSSFNMNAKDVIFALAHASPEKRCKAALLAVKEKEKENV